MRVAQPYTRMPIILLCLIGCPLFAAAVPKPSGPPTLYNHVVTAWQAAGGVIDWVEADAQQPDAKLYLTRHDLADPIPVITFYHLPKEGFAELPAPSIPILV